MTDALEDSKLEDVMMQTHSLHLGLVDAVCPGHVVMHITIHCIQQIRIKKWVFVAGNLLLNSSVRLQTRISNLCSNTTFSHAAAMKYNQAALKTKPTPIVHTTLT